MVRFERHVHPGSRTARGALSVDRDLLSRKEQRRDRRAEKDDGNAPQIRSPLPPLTASPKPCRNVRPTPGLAASCLVGTSEQCPPASRLRLISLASCMLAISTSRSRPLSASPTGTDTT